MQEVTNWRKKRPLTKLAVMALLASGVSHPTRSQDAVHTDIGDIDQTTGESAFPKKRPYSPWAGRSFPMRPLFGDTHLHTALSFDAGAAGARIGPREAYRFAKGEEITAPASSPSNSHARWISSW